jgi:outer membrane lipopolysaccharide assembly protein LptE/RlpB
MYETIDAELRRRFYDDPDRAALITDCERKVLENQLSPFAAAALLLK